LHHISLKLYFWDAVSDSDKTGDCNHSEHGEENINFCKETTINSWPVTLLTDARIYSENAI
jgi:hypothetical protein